MAGSSANADPRVRIDLAPNRRAMSKATHETERSQVSNLTDIVGVGPSIAGDFQLLGINTPQELIGQDPMQLYHAIIEKTGHFHDPCVLDVFMAAVDFMNGNKPQNWWHYTSERKLKYTKDVDALRTYPLAT